jgi:hypothetical protein
MVNLIIDFQIKKVNTFHGEDEYIQMFYDSILVAEIEVNEFTNLLLYKKIKEEMSK